MVCSWGMSGKLGPVTFGKTTEHMFLGKEIQQSVNYSDATSELIDSEIKAFVENAEKTEPEVGATLENDVSSGGIALSWGEEGWRRGGRGRGAEEDRGVARPCSRSGRRPPPRQEGPYRNWDRENFVMNLRFSRQWRSSSRDSILKKGYVYTTESTLLLNDIQHI